MKSLLFAAVAAIVLFVAAEANAHHGDVVIVRDAFGNARAVQVGPTFHARGPVVVRGNCSAFNQNGGVNRIGLRR